MAIIVPFFVGCSNDELVNKIDQMPVGVFEGTWTWVETVGLDLTGNPYIKTPQSEGYTWKYKFFNASGASGLLESYKNDLPIAYYSYNYTASTDADEQLITVYNSDNTLNAEMFWRRQTSETETHLFLKGANKNLPSYEYHFVKN